MAPKIVKNLAPFFLSALIIVAAITVALTWRGNGVHAPEVILGEQQSLTRPVAQAQFTYPETAVRNDDTIYVANALGGTIEVIRGETITTIFQGFGRAKFNDIIVTDDGLLVLDAGNAKILNMGFDGKVSSVIDIPKMSDAEDIDLFAAASIDEREGHLLIAGLPAQIAPSGSVLGMGPSMLLEFDGRTWTTIETAADLVGTGTTFRDAVYDRDGSIAFLASDFFGILRDGEASTVNIGAKYGGGIFETDAGWLVGAHTQMLAISRDMQVTPHKMPMSFANVGDIQPDGDAMLVTDTDRQVVYEIGAGPKVTTYGGAAAMKIADMAVAPDGKLLLLENSSPRVLSYSWPWGLQTIAGSGKQVRAYSAAKATSYPFYFPSGMAVAPDGSIYVSEAGYRVVRIKDGKVTMYAGGLNPGVPTEGQNVKDVKFGALRGLDIDAEGRLLIVDRGNNSVWRVERDNTISRVMGTGEKGMWKEGEPANTQPLNSPMDVLAREDGSILIADTYNNTIARIDPQGIVHRFAGVPKTQHYQGFGGYSGDGGPALDAEFNTPWRMAQGDDGSVYVLDGFNNAVRRIKPDGTISTVAGGKLGRSDDGTEMNLPAAIAVIGSTLYVGDAGNSRVMAFPIGP